MLGSIICIQRREAYSEGFLYAEGGRWRSLATPRDFFMPTAKLEGWPPRAIRRRPRQKAVGLPAAKVLDFGRKNRNFAEIRPFRLGPVFV